MPGKKPAKPKPSEYLIVTNPQMPGAFAGPAGEKRRIEAFPLVDGHAYPGWVDLPARKAVKQVNFALPAGAHPMPLYDPTGPADLRPVRSLATARKRLLLISEGYPDDGAALFFDACNRMSTKLLATPPFNAVAHLIAIEGLFLPLRGSAVVNISCSRTPENLRRLRPTLFGTQCCLDGRTSHLWGGDEERVRKLAGKALREKGRQLEEFLCLAVLIHSNEYGGAGSIAVNNPRFAWATTGSPHSVNILLHELGHALGLQDEYERTQDGPAKPWRNISRFEKPRDTPWHRLVTEPDNQLTLETGGHWPGSLADVGTFEGAGYQPEGRYRPSFDCRMRTLESGFCPVCSDHILAELDPAHERRVGSEN